MRRSPPEDGEPSSVVNLESPDPSEETEGAMRRMTEGPDDAVVEETGGEHQDLEVRRQRRGKMIPEEF